MIITCCVQLTLTCLYNVCLCVCVRLMSAESSEMDYCVQLTLTCLYNVCRRWSVVKPPSQPGNTLVHCLDILILSGSGSI